MSNRPYFVYARFGSKLRAYDALEQMHADGEVSPCEVHSIACANGVWEVRLFAD